MYEMLKYLHNRYFITGCILAVIFLLMIYQLADIQIVNGQSYYDKSQEGKRKTLPLKGIRGKILDTNGVPLAYSQKSYDVEFYKDPSKNMIADRKMYTTIIMNTIQIIEKNDGSCIDTFAIKIKQDQSAYEFNWGDVSTSTVAKREKEWRKNMGINTVLSPNNIMLKLRDRYQIPANLSSDTERKILSVWQEAQFSSYRAYLPVKVAQNVSMSTVSEVETRNMELAGMNITESYTRIYPKETLASHIIGYIGRIYPDEGDVLAYIQTGLSRDNAIEKVVKGYEAKGYTREDLLGRTGIEYTMESYLTGNTKERQGQRIVEVNNRGKITRELSVISPQPGKNVILTIDSKLQLKLEEALQKNIYNIRNLPLNENPAYLAETGSAVVMDVNSGNILAMTSYPSFDPNLFTNGFSQKEYDVIKNDTRNPLFNRAISSRATPGSIFKMVTGLAGLMEGKITVDEKIDDLGPFTLYTNKNNIAEAPTCWVKPNYNAHKNQDMISALKNSCNYYFFTVSSRLGIDLLNKWSDLLGLSKTTGIELPSEVFGQIANQQTLLKTSIPILVKQKIKEVINRKAGVVCDDKTLAMLITLDPSTSLPQNGPQIRKILQDQLHITDTQIRSDLSSDISGYLTEIIWNPNRTIVTGIGQSVTTLTPIGVARYVAALVNGGKVLEANIIKKIVDSSGKTISEKKPVVVNQLKIPDLYIKNIKEGMKEVVSPEDGGTAAKYFADFIYKNNIGAKTGTAQVSNKPEDDNAWFLAFAPFDKPEIAVVVLIPKGAHGAYASPTVRDIIQFYMDRKIKGNSDLLQEPDNLVK